MKGWYWGVVIIILMIILFSCSRNFSEQSLTKSFGGTTSVELDPNRKLINIAWNNGSLWYLVRPMRPDEEAETYVFREQDVWGMLEGSVTLIEQKLSEDEYKKWLDNKQFEQDYFRSGNLLYTNDGTHDNYVEVYIHYEDESGEYSLLRPYIVTDDGSLAPAN